MTSIGFCGRSPQPAARRPEVTPNVPLCTATTLRVQAPEVAHSGGSVRASTMDGNYTSNRSDRHRTGRHDRRRADSAGRRQPTRGAVVGHSANVWRARRARRLKPRPARVRRSPGACAPRASFPAGARKPAAEGDFSSVSELAVPAASKPAPEPDFPSGDSSAAGTGRTQPCHVPAINPPADQDESTWTGSAPSR